MVGNVWEWTSSIAMSYPYDITLDEFNLTGLEKSVDSPITVRGGSFASPSGFIRSAHRESAGPGDISLQTGFRCAHSF